MKRWIVNGLLAVAVVVWTAGVGILALSYWPGRVAIGARAMSEKGTLWMKWEARGGRGTRPGVLRTTWEDQGIWRVKRVEESPVAVGGKMRWVSTEVWVSERKEGLVVTLGLLPAAGFAGWRIGRWWKKRSMKPRDQSSEPGRARATEPEKRERDGGG